MNITSNTHNPVLVAPRPVRLITFAPFRPLQSPHRPRQPDPSGGSPSADRDIPSPHSSPRSALPSEALEEFLSILRPSFPPTSPRSIRHPAPTLPPFQHDRPFSLKPRGRIDVAKTPVDDIDNIHPSQQSRTGGTHTPDSPLSPSPTIEIEYPLATSPPIRWFTSHVLSSPISRNQTRNPFLKQASNQIPTFRPVLSPHSIPLPSPSPDELMNL